MTQGDWEQSVPEEIRCDVLWKIAAYRFSLFLGELAESDAGKILRLRRAYKVADQLQRSSGDISAAIAEGYSRTGGADRARFFEYALGSAREARDWYYKNRETLGKTVFEHRLKLSTQIIKLLITMIRQQRGPEGRRPK